MGFMDKVMFWKKDDFDFDNMSNDPMSDSSQMSDPSQDPFNNHQSIPNDPTQTQDFAPNPPAPGYNPSSHSPSPDSFSQANPSMNSGSVSQREIELLNSKLDTIKALLASLDQRVGVIEQIARAEQVRMQQEQQGKQGNHLW